MRVMPQSLSGRLLAGGALLIAIAMVVAGLLIGSILDHFVVGQIDQRLDSTVNDMFSQLTIAEDGTLTLGTRGEGPDFLRPGSGWYWQVSSGQSILHSPNLQTTLSVDPPRFDWRNLFSGGASPTRAVDADGISLHGRIKMATVNSHSVTVVATSPQMAIGRPLFDGLVSILLCLAVISMLLLLGLLLLVRIGLRPLRDLRDEVAQISDGRSHSVNEDLPGELRPLAAELNKLVRLNAERLQSTRLQAANLAHSLKTPLASLSLALADIKARPELLQLVKRMQDSIAHHLGRTRIAVTKDKKQSLIEVLPRLNDIIVALQKIYADRHIRIVLDCPASATVACDPGDFDEIAGNLLENGFKWTQSELRVEVLVKRGFFLQITDDGPGLTREQISEALRPGQRLDEKTPGDGFGLSIVSELVDLYGGRLNFAPRAEGYGLVVTVEIPDR